MSVTHCTINNTSQGDVKGKSHGVLNNVLGLQSKKMTIHTRAGY